MKSDAVWVVAPNQIEIRPQEIPPPAWNEVQIEVKACGICALDTALYQGISANGPMPYVLGHEAVGVICAAGEGVREFKAGDKVYTANGGSNNQMSRYINNLAAGVGRLPDGVEDYENWVMEPVCCVVNLLRCADIQPGDRVALVGAGYMGLLTLMGLAHTLAGHVAVFETSPENRARAEQYGPDCVLDPYSQEGTRYMDQLQAGGGADVVIDFSNCDAGYEVAGKLLRAQSGKLILGSWYRHTMPFDGTLWHLRGLSVLNASPMMNPFYNETVVRQAGRLVERGVFKPGELISHTVFYDDPGLNSLFQTAVHRGDRYMKGVVLFR